MIDGVVEVAGFFQHRDRLRGFVVELHHAAVVVQQIVANLGAVGQFGRDGELAGIELGLRVGEIRQLAAFRAPCRYFRARKRTGESRHAWRGRSAKSANFGPTGFSFQPEISWLPGAHGLPL